MGDPPGSGGLFLGMAKISAAIRRGVPVYGTSARMAFLWIAAGLCRGREQGIRWSKRRETCGRYRAGRLEGLSDGFCFLLARQPRFGNFSTEWTQLDATVLSVRIVHGQYNSGTSRQRFKPGSCQNKIQDTAILHLPLIVRGYSMIHYGLSRQGENPLASPGNDGRGHQTEQTQHPANHRDQRNCSEGVRKQLGSAMARFRQKQPSCGDHHGDQHSRDEVRPRFSALYDFFLVCFHLFSRRGSGNYPLRMIQSPHHQARIGGSSCQGEGTDRKSHYFLLAGNTAGWQGHLVVSEPLPSSNDGRQEAKSFRIDQAVPFFFIRLCLAEKALGPSRARHRTIPMANPFAGPATARAAPMTAASPLSVLFFTSPMAM